MSLTVTVEVYSQSIFFSAFRYLRHDCRNVNQGIWHYIKRSFEKICIPLKQDLFRSNVIDIQAARIIYGNTNWPTSFLRVLLIVLDLRVLLQIHILAQNKRESIRGSIPLNRI